MQQDMSQFGIQADDEWTHRFSQDHPDWNESYFFDWYNHDGSMAGHCRIGWHPVQQRVFFWLHIWHQQEWLIIEEARLPDSALIRDNDFAMAYQQFGLSFGYRPITPLQQGELNVNGFARVTQGKRQGQIVAIDLNVKLQAIGPAYTRGGGSVESHSAEGFATDRYEQPINLAVDLKIDQQHDQYQARGERDHSWGPRPWDMQWQFFVVNNHEFSLQATEVVLPDFPLIQIGYLYPHGGTMQHLEQIQFELDFDPMQPSQAVTGRFHLSSATRALNGTIATIAGSEIDITHTFMPPKRTEYRRSLVRCDFDDGTSSIGWLECNRPSPSSL